MGARFGGLVLDSILVGVIAFLISLPFGSGFHKTQTCNFNGDCTTEYHYGSGWLVDILALVIGIAYSAYFVGVRTQTLGHKAAGIRVVNVDTGQPIGAGMGALRWFVMVITGAICTLGYWSPFFDSERRRGWHDKSSNAIAITAR